MVKKWVKDLNRQLTDEDIHMENKHMKIYTSFFIIEIKIKTIIRNCPH